VMRGHEIVEVCAFSKAAGVYQEVDDPDAPLREVVPRDDCPLRLTTGQHRKCPLKKMTLLGSSGTDRPIRAAACTWPLWNGQLIKSAEGVRRYHLRMIGKA
jgi:hypothetical protein